MQFKADFFKNYLQHAPLPLAIERTMECQILSKQKFEGPILDIGCGDGIFAYNLFAEKIDVGIDPNAKELECAKKLDIYNNIFNCYGDNIPMPSGHFKTIFSNSVMEHIPEIDRVLIEAHRLLDPEGVMYLTLPTNLFERYTVIYRFLRFVKLNAFAIKYAKFFNKFWQHYHANDAKSWIQLFDKCGFRVAHIQEYGPQSISTFNDFLAPFSLFPFITKKLWNKWFFRKARLLTAPLLNKIYGKIINSIETSEGRGGLIFFEIRKKC